MTVDLALRPAILSPQRRKVLAYVAQFPDVPSLAQVAGHMGWENKSSVSEVFATLRGAGLMDRLPRQGRQVNWYVTDEGHKALKAS